MTRHRLLIAGLLVSTGLPAIAQTNPGAASYGPPLTRYCLDPDRG